MQTTDTLTCEVTPGSVDPTSLSCSVTPAVSLDFWAALTPQILWASGTALLVALFTTVIAQYLFAPWLEVRKQILIEQAREQAKVAGTVRVLLHHLRDLNLIRTDISDNALSQTLWEKSMDAYRHAVLEPDSVFPVMPFPVGRTLSSLLTSAEWIVHLVHFRHMREKSPVTEVMAVVEELAKAVDPTRFPMSQRFHALRGLRKARKLTKATNGTDFGE